MRDDRRAGYGRGLTKCRQVLAISSPCVDTNSKGLPKARLIGSPVWSISGISPTVWSAPSFLLGLIQFLTQMQRNNMAGAVLLVRIQREMKCSENSRVHPGVQLLTQMQRKQSGPPRSTTANSNAAKTVGSTRSTTANSNEGKRYGSNRYTRTKSMRTQMQRNSMVGVVLLVPMQR